MTMTDEMHHEYGLIYRPFGPMIYQQEISQELFDDLLQSGEKSTENFRQHLAGNMKDERGLTKLISEDSKEEMLDRCALYVAGAEGKPPEYRQHLQNRVEFILDDVWINYMQAYEWNPPHSHSGNLSFVIYLSNPVDQTIEENHETQRETNAPSAGRITFRYGEKHDMSNNFFHYLPRAKDMLIFPSWLEHQVFQYTQEATRISVAGNVFIRYK